MLHAENLAVKPTLLHSNGAVSLRWELYDVIFVIKISLNDIMFFFCKHVFVKTNSVAVVNWGCFKMWNFMYLVTYTAVTF